MTLSPSVTAPVPRFSVLVPVKVKLPFQFWALLPALTMAAAPVSTVVPAPMLNVPAPSALTLAMTSVPAAKTRPPEPVLLPLSVSTPAPVLLMRWLMATAPLTVRDEPLAPPPTTSQV